MEASRPLDSPARTGNLVLKTRVAVLIRNLEVVQRALEGVKDRRANLRQLLEVPQQIDESIASLNRWVRLGVDGYNGEDWRSVATALEELERELSTLADRVAGFHDPVKNLQGAALLEDEVAKADEVATAVHDSLKKEIREKFGENFADLESLIKEISAAGMQGGARADASVLAMTTSWTKYTNELYASSEKLFAEYVELVGGVAIRDTGLDRGICRIAEDVLKPVRRIGNFTWNNLTIPTRQEAFAVTAARIVRLGFPEWSIWALPLTAKELGTDFADWDRDITSYVEKHDGDRAELLMLLADAFATYFMGPAYACAVILMRLNPAAAFAKDRLVAKRVAVILSVLRRMSAQERANEDLYRPITSRLAVEWEDAMGQTGWVGSATRAGQGTGATRELEGWLPAEELAAVKRCTGLTDDEQTAIDRLLNGFERFVWSKRLDINAWPTVESWAQKLRTGKELSASELGEFDELRYVLNAAWRTRIAVQQGERDIDDPAKLRAIADAVEKLLWTVLERPGEGSRRPSEKRRSLQLHKQSPAQTAQPGASQPGVA